MGNALGGEERVYKVKVYTPNGTFRCFFVAVNDAFVEQLYNICLYFCLCLLLLLSRINNVHIYIDLKSKILDLFAALSL